MIIQPSLYVPPEIQKGLLSGEYIRYGGTVRDQLGQIVKSLSDVDVPTDSKRAMGQAAAALKNPWVLTTVSVVVVAVGVTAFIVGRKTKQGDKATMPECVERYNASLGAYLDAVRVGQLDADIIDRLISDFDAVRAYSDENGGIALDLKTKQGESLFNLVVDYTRHLAEANSIDLGGLQEPTTDSKNDPVVDLRRHLAFQRKVFTEAA